jgi:tellurite methyltransferase
MTDYETLYAEGQDVCGQPFPELVRFFEAQPAGLRVLDLGCGQGRDTLMVARLGHQVVGVDLSPTGVAQMLATAADADLSVTGQVADIAGFEPDGTFDVVVIDRVLHMLGDAATRQGVLARTGACVRPGGHLVIADTPKNLPLVRAFMESRDGAWSLTFARKGFLFWQRAAP